MKTVFFTIVIFFSFSVLTAQINTDNSPLKNNPQKTSKVDFFKELVEKNNFEIEITTIETKTEPTSKKDFYTALIENNDFNIKIANPIQLAQTTNNKKGELTNTTKIASLVP